MNRLFNLSQIKWAHSQKQETLYDRIILAVSLRRWNLAAEDH